MREECNKFLKKQSKKCKQKIYKKYKVRNLYVKNFDENVIEDNLRDIFLQFGTIEIQKLKFSNNSALFALLIKNMPTNSSNINNKQIYVAQAQSKKDRLKKQVSAKPIRAADNPSTQTA